MPEIRDPVHGPIALSDAELAVVDCPVYQRLRNVKQLGFAEMTFPGATHNRYVHGLGAMHLGGRAFDSAFAEADWLAGSERVRIRQIVRLAALLHDIGHPPLSHTLERILPPAHEVPGALASADDPRPASHEDMTIALIMHSDLTDVLRDQFGGIGIDPAMIAGLISEDVAVADGAYTIARRHLRPILSQLVSSELDVDRMDYLLRDAYFTGTSYGQFDLDWLLGGLRHHVTDENRVHLGLDGRALLSFEDFLLSRYHMFVMVYFHHRTNAYDRMILQFFDEVEPTIALPADPASYTEIDDPWVVGILRAHSENEWGRRILDRQPVRRVLELEGQDSDGKREMLSKTLTDAGMRPRWITSKGVLSKYYGREGHSTRTIYVLHEAPDARTQPLSEATPLFARYRDPTVLNRLYVDPEHIEEAIRLASNLAK